MDVEVFYGSPLNFKYFMSVVKEVAGKKLDDPRGHLTRLIKCTSAEAKKFVRNCIHLPPEEFYEQAMALLQERYGDPCQVLMAYGRKIKELPVIKPGDRGAFSRFSKFSRNTTVSCRRAIAINLTILMCCLC